jgi:hypothetical protein
MFSDVNLGINQTFSTPTGTSNVQITGTPTVDVTDRIARLLGHVQVDSLPGVDVVDRIARLLGHVIVDSGSVTAYQGPSNALYGGQVAVAVGAAALPNQAGSSFSLQADPANTVNLLVGNAGGQTYVLTPGSSVSVTISNLNLAYAKAVAAGVSNLNWLGLS